MPAFYIEPIKRDLEWLWDWLPEGARSYDPNAYLTSLEGGSASNPEARAGMAVV